MSDIMKNIYQRAKLINKHIVLAEGEEPRVIEAAIRLTRKNIARISLLGNKEVIQSRALESLDGVNIIEISKSESLDKYADLLYQLRQAKGVTKEKARELVKDPLYFGTLMVKSGDADGMVAGSINSTGDVLRPAFQLIKAQKGIKTISSCFIMVMPSGTAFGYDGVMIFGDCAVNINPTAEHLVDIAIASAESAKNLAGIPLPKIAMLSFSTKGSAKHELADKVIEATKLIKEAMPELDVDGELQADTALIKSVAFLKAPESHVAGQANVLVFPDLQSGNISYKLVQRLAGAEAIGPICQGLDKPVNDLSRGCTADDIIGVVAITALQAM